MGAPYSIVCAAGHVLDDERAHEPPKEIDGHQRCSVSGCFEFVYGHCPHCGVAIPGYIDGPRPEVHGNIGMMRGRLSIGGYPVREWREDCPQCKVPYPWAEDVVLVNYQRRYLTDLEEGTPSLPLVQRAAGAYARQQKANRRATKRDRRQSVKQRVGRVWSWFDSTLKKAAALIAAIAVVAGAVIGVLKWAQDPPQPVPPPTSTTVTGSTP